MAGAAFVAHLTHAAAQNLRYRRGMRGVLTTVLIGCGVVAAGVGVFAVRDGTTVMHEIEALLCLLVVAVCAGAGLIVHAVDEQTMDE